MHGVHHGRLVVEYDADRGVLAEVVYVPLGVVWVGGVARVGEVEDRETAAFLAWVLRSERGGPHS